MSGILHILDQKRLIGPNGRNVGGSIYFYTTGTLTPATIYSDAGLTTPLANPVVIAAGGQVPAIYLDPAVTYRRRIVWDDTLLTPDDVDPYGAPFVSTVQLASSSGASLIGKAGGGTVQDALDAPDAASELTTRIAPPVGPSVAINATAGNLNGTYRYRITFVTADGETEASGESAAVTPASQRVDLTIATGPAGVTARKIYRNPAAAVDTVLMQLVATIADNTTTTYTDNIADGALGAAVPWFNTTGGNITVNGVTFGSISDLNTRIGQAAYPNQTGYANTAYGAASMRAMTTGYRCTAVGVFALDGNTTGARNTGMGVHALNDNATGNDNTAVGFNAGFNVETSFNTAVGSNCLANATTGTQNTAVGAASSQLITTGNNNASLGYNAGFGITTGSNNVAIGMEAGQVIGAGNFNTLIGMQCGKNTTASNNVCIGFQSLFNATSAGDNAAIGTNAGRSITTGGANCFIGTNAGNSGSQKVDAFNTTVIGQGTFSDADNQVVIGNTSVEQTRLRGILRGSVYTAATIPIAASTAGAGARTFISDSNVAASGNFGAVAAGGGSEFVPLYSDGTAWRIG